MQVVASEVFEQRVEIQRCHLPRTIDAEDDDRIVRTTLHAEVNATAGRIHCEILDCDVLFLCTGAAQMVVVRSEAKRSSVFMAATRYGTMEPNVTNNGEIEVHTEFIV